MALGRQPEQRQGDFWVATERLAPAPAHPFYQQLNALLASAGFDPFCQAACAKFYAQKLGRPSIPPGAYFRMLMMGYFEKLDSERESAWRCADSLALWAFSVTGWTRARRTIRACRGRGTASTWRRIRRCSTGCSSG